MAGATCPFGDRWEGKFCECRWVSWEISVCGTIVHKEEEEEEEEDRNDED